MFVNTVDGVQGAADAERQVQVDELPRRSNRPKKPNLKLVGPGWM
jgi:hypothetical protein